MPRIPLPTMETLALRSPRHYHPMLKAPLKGSVEVVVGLWDLGVLFHIPFFSW